MRRGITSAKLAMPVNGAAIACVSVPHTTCSYRRAACWRRTLAWEGAEDLYWPSKARTLKYGTRKALERNSY